MEEITKLIQKYDINHSEEQSQPNIQTNESVLFLDPNNLNQNKFIPHLEKIKSYKRTLIIAKVIKIMI